MSEVDWLGGEWLDPREVLVERFQRRKDGEQRWPGDWFHHEPTAFLSQNGLVTRQLQVARNAECLVATVLEETHVTFGVHRGLVTRHMPSICCPRCGSQVRPHRMFPAVFRATLLKKRDDQ